MSAHRPIRDLRKRFQITLYHLRKISEDWGQCAGISANDTYKIDKVRSQLETLFSSRKFSAYASNPFIPEEEFDNEPQATKKLEADNKLLRDEVEKIQRDLDLIKKKLGI